MQEHVSWRMCRCIVTDMYVGNCAGYRILQSYINGRLHRVYKYVIITCVYTLMSKLIGIGYRPHNVRPINM